MKQLNFIIAFLILAIPLLLSSCEIIGGIFKAGMGFGIFLVIAVVGLVIFVFAKMFGGGK